MVSEWEPPPQERRSWPGVGLRWQILTRLVLITGTLFVLVSLVVLEMTHRTLEREAAHATRTLAGVAATMTGAAIEPDLALQNEMNSENLRRVVELFTQSFDAEMIEVVDTSGRLVARSPDDEAPLWLRADLHERARTEQGVVETQGDGRTEITSPIWDDAGVLRATVYVGMGRQRVAGQIQRTQTLLLLYLGLDLLLVLVVGYLLLTRLVVLPIARVRSATDRTARGEFPSPIDTSDRNELGDLARNFNRMVQRVREGRAALEAKVAELEVSNELVAKTRDELVRSEKLATVGQLAAGLAHEVGNPLSAVIGLVDVLEMEARDGALTGEDAGELAARIRRELGRIDTTIHELLRFAREEREEPGPVPLVAAIDQAVGLAQHHPRSRQVEHRWEPSEEIGCVHAHATESAVVQVLLNLLINAADAMGGQGHVTISVTEEGAVARIDVDDEGPGIAESDVSRIFEPFYTTKAPGEGTGLGLSISERLVRGFGGRIEGGRSPSGGARFTVRLPRSAQDSPGTPSGK